METIHYLRKIFQPINQNPMVAGIAMLTLNIGSKYIELGFTKTQEQALRAGLARELLIFAMMFVSTKDIFLSILLTSAFTVLANYLLNDTSSYCIIPKHLRKIQIEMDVNDDNIISEEEERNALELLKKAKKQKQKQNQANFINYMYENSYSEFNS